MTQRPQPRIRRAYAPQLRLSRNELGRLENRIEEDYTCALADHQERMERFRKYLRRWRDLTDMAAEGEEDLPNFRVPMTRWHVFSEWANEYAALFGDDAEIIAKPVGPSDQRYVHKVARYAQWRLFQSMRVRKPAAVFSFRRILFGRAHAYAPWVRQTFFAPTEGGGELELLDYEGPGFEVLQPDDLIVPGEEADSIQKFSYVLRKYQESPDQLLRGDGVLYQGIDEAWDELVRLAEQRRDRDYEGDVLKRELDLAEGVVREGNVSARGAVRVWEWYGKWRRLRKGAGDGSATNYKRRERFEAEVLVRYQPDLHRVIGVQDLAEMYPRMVERRPFVESALVCDGSYWGPSFGELLEAVENQASAAHNLGTEAGKFSVGPVIFYRPAEGFDPDNIPYEPMMSVATADPRGINVVRMQADLQYPIVEEQACLGYAERLTGRTETNLGRASDRPNAPRTARQTLALLEEGNVRASLDISILREDWAAIAARVWLLDSMYAPESVFFRVTEEDARGLFDTKNGGATMTQQERGGKFDFDIRFATSYWAREAKRDRQLALYQLDLQNPLVAQNPRALYQITRQIHQAFGDERFSDLVPEPPDLGLPVNPREEWTMALQGEEIPVHPEDNDELHLLDHNKRLREARIAPERDEDAFHRMVSHTLDHMAQWQQKKLMAALVDRLTQSLGQNAEAGQGLQPFTPPVPMQGLQQLLATMQGGGGQGAVPGGAAPPGQL